MTVLLDGYLDSVPRFRLLTVATSHKRARECYSSIHNTISNLGRAVQLGQHRHLIDSLNNALDADTLEAIAVASYQNRELCAALSVYLTTLEQAYAWPRRDTVATPKSIHNHKLAIQVLYHQPLTAILTKRLRAAAVPCTESVPLSEIALATANALLQKADEAKRRNEPLPPPMQDQVNMLFRNCCQDWYSQGDYQNEDSHAQFGRLHEVIHTNGTQRSVQEIFQNSSGVAQLREAHTLLCHMPATASALVKVLHHLQVSVSLAREELMAMTIDEVVWGQTFAKFAKPVGHATLGAGGADCPMFRMLDALCGRHDPATADTLLEELTMRSRNFPPNIQSLIRDIVSAPSLRGFATSRRASPGLRDAFAALQQLMHSLYEMHRKKALRIVLALRAGQLYTSSGVQDAPSPERHLAASLQSAMDVRFGSDALERTIPAYGSIRDVIVNLKGHVELAKICFTLDTPIVVAPGDAIIVTVAVGSSMQSRTYSITGFRSSTDDEESGNGDPTLSSAMAVEICCRNRGVVSSVLCSQRVDFPVRLALQPSPYFRIAGNKRADEFTIFVGQNGGAGIFCDWLSRQTRPVGKYILVIGARRLGTFPFASEVFECSASCGDHLQIILCLSQPNEQDTRRMQCGGVLPFAGRVGRFLANEPLPQAKATYVCGSAEFGIDVARKLKEMNTTKNCPSLSPRSSPVVTSKMPNLRLHVASSLCTQRDRQTRRPISRWELALHNTPGDIWIALDSIVYDISLVSSFHPGGEKMLLCRAGLEAGDMFNAVHSDSFETRSILQTLQIGHLQADDQDNTMRRQCLDFVVQIQNDLTNSSRFEQRPTGSIHQLPRVPPTEVIRGSWTQFIAGWAAMLRGLSLHDKLTEPLPNVIEEWYATKAKKLRQVYESDFDDLRRCATAMQDVFDAHYKFAAKIHAVLDTLKPQLRHSCDDELQGVVAAASRALVQAARGRDSPEQTPISRLP